MAGGPGRLTSPYQHDPQVVLCKCERDSIVERLMESHCPLREVRRLVDIAKLLVRLAQAAVQDRQPAQILDHLSRGDRLLIRLDRGFPAVVGGMHSTEH